MKSFDVRLITEKLTLTWIIYHCVFPPKMTSKFLDSLYDNRPQDDRSLPVREIYVIDTWKEGPFYYFKVTEGYAATLGLRLTQRGIRWFRDVFQKTVMEALGEDAKVAIYINWGREHIYIRYQDTGPVDLTEALKRLPEC